MKRAVTGRGPFRTGQHETEIEACIRFSKQHTKADAPASLRTRETWSRRLRPHRYRTSSAPSRRLAVSRAEPPKHILTTRKHSLTPPYICLRTVSWHRFHRSVDICAGMVYNENVTAALPDYSAGMSKRRFGSMSTTAVGKQAEPYAARSNIFAAPGTQLRKRSGLFIPFSRLPHHRPIRAIPLLLLLQSTLVGLTDRL